MNESFRKLGHAWSHPIETSRQGFPSRLGMVSTVMFGGVEAVNTTALALGEVNLLNFAWTSVVFLGAVANASSIIVKGTALPNHSEESNIS